jgi:hypothetical protein
MTQSKLSMTNKSGDGESLPPRENLARRRVERVIRKMLAKQRFQQRGFLRHADFESESNELISFSSRGRSLR